MATARLSVKEIFLHAAEITSPADRAAYLDQACEADAEQRKRVEALLIAHERPESLVDRPAVNVQPPEVTIDHAPTERPGTLVAGRYKLLEQIGEGGMGTVWIAEQTQPVRRKVALKLVKLGMDSRQVLSRFEAERQALALMDHPNIAKVFDGGLTEHGRPFFVMEYVKGVPLTEYCDKVRLSIQQRLKLFAQVCQAVQHAHQKGIIHRDLKPSNILVCLYDGQPVPKVIDFGLAKAIHQPLTEHTLHTAHGLMVGTPLYMSPEQAEFNNLDVDTRTDIYSLGVILYELLTGTTPLEKQQFKNAAFAEMLRLIKEEEPLKPSLKLSTNASLPSIAAQRSLEPAQLSRAVRGDLDWIVMKSLEKERSRRYETANGLARDIDRYLCDEPVEACPPSTGYRLKKLLRRNKGPALAAAIVLLTLVGGVIGTTWGLIRAEKSRQAEAQQRKLAQSAEATARANEQHAAAERNRAVKAEADANEERSKAVTEKQRADEEAAVAKAVKDFLQNRLLSQADPETQIGTLVRSEGTSSEINPNPTIRELLDRAAAELTPERIETQFPNMPLVQAEILRTIGDTYRRLGDRFGPTVGLLERSRDLYVAQRGPDHPETLTTLNNLGLAYMKAYKDREATQALQQVCDKRIAILGPDHPDTLTAMHNLAWAYRDAQRFPESVRLFEEVRDKRTATLGPDHLDTLYTLHELAWAYWNNRQYQQSVQLFEQVRDQRIARLGPDHPQVLWTLTGLAGVYESTGKLSEAIQLLEHIRDKRIAALGSDHEHTRRTLYGLASAYQTAGKLPEAIQLYEQLRDKQISTLGSDHASTLSTLGKLAFAYRSAGKAQEAIKLYEQIRDHQNVTLGPDHPTTLTTLANLASTYRLAGKFPEAIQLHEQVRDHRIAKLGPDHPSTLITLNDLAYAYHTAGKLPEAIQLYEQLRDKQVAKLPSGHVQTLTTMNNLARAYRSTGRIPEAIQLHEQVRDQHLAKLGPNHSLTLTTINDLALAYRAAGRLPEALQLWEEMIPIARRVRGPTHAFTITETQNWCNALDQDKQFDKAAMIRRELLDIQRKQFPAADPRLDGALAALGLSLLNAERFADAEPILNELLIIREQARPDSWLTFNTKSSLGGALGGQKKLADAEPLLLAGYEGMKEREATIPVSFRALRLAEALQRLIDLYTAWDKPDEAAKWRKILDDQKTAKTPALDTTENP